MSVQILDLTPFNLFNVSTGFLDFSHVRTKMSAVQKGAYLNRGHKWNKYITSSSLTLSAGFSLLIFIQGELF